MHELHASQYTKRLEQKGAKKRFHVISRHTRKTNVKAYQNAGEHATPPFGWLGHLSDGSVLSSLSIDLNGPSLLDSSSCFITQSTRKKKRTLQVGIPETGMQKPKLIASGPYLKRDTPMVHPPRSRLVAPNATCGLKSCGSIVFCACCECKALTACPKGNDDEQ